MILPPFETLPRSSSPVTSLAVSRNGDLLFVATSSGIDIYSTSSLTHVRTFPTFPAGAVKALTFQGGRAYTAHQDAKIRVWTSRHSLFAALPTYADLLFRLPFPRNYVAVRRHRRRLWIQHADAVSGLALHGELLFSVSWDKSLKVWRQADLRCLQSIPAHDDAVNAVAAAGDGAVYTGAADGVISVWRVSRMEAKRYFYAHAGTLSGHKSAVNALVFSSDGSTLFSGSADKTIRVWEKEAAAGVIVGHGGPVMSLASSGPLIVSGSSDRTVRIWRRRRDGGFACLSILAGHSGGVRAVAAFYVSPAECRVFSGAADGDVSVWKVNVTHSSKQ